MMKLTLLKVLILMRQVYYLPILAFLDKGFKFQQDVCSGCFHKLIMFMDLNNIAILSIHDVVPCCIINGISKSEAVNAEAVKVLL